MGRFAAIALLILALGLGLFGSWSWNRAQLESSQDQPIQTAAIRYSVDPSLVKALVWRESRFDPSARGRAGELGLMQLREIAAQEWADAERVTGYDHDHCLDASTNTLAGTFYLGKLLRRYRHTDNPVPYALADYNAGRSNVLKWMQGVGTTNSAVFIEQIGFPGTRDYVMEVMKRSQRYQR
jgi:soluble lytic murein transglycosylase